MLSDGAGLMRLHVPGATLAVRERGVGEPLLLLHGGMGTAANDWGPIVPSLARTNRVITLDVRAHGDSEPGEQPLGMHRFGLDVTHVLARLGVGRAVMMGFSMGANTLLRLVASRPWLARALILVGGSARNDPQRIRRMFEQPWPDDLVGLHDREDDGYAEWLKGHLRDDWIAHAEQPAGELMRVTCPTLLCQGDRDPVQRLDEAARLLRSLPAAELLVVPRAGHAAHLDRPELVVSAVSDFLSRRVRIPTRGGPSA